MEIRENALTAIQQDLVSAARKFWQNSIRSARRLEAVICRQAAEGEAKANPDVAPFVRQLLSADQYINGSDRWVLWLLDAPPKLIRDNEGLRERIEAVRAFRQASPKGSTRRMADKPTLFDQIRQPTQAYILIPRHSSENRRYVPFGYFGPDVIISDSCTAVPGASLYHFGMLSCSMHMAWMRQVCGRFLLSGGC